MRRKWKSTWTGLLLGLVVGAVLAYGLIRWQSENRGVEVNGWRVSMGTGNFGNDYLLRAAIAVYSLGNAIPEEALFFHAFKDVDDQKLSGQKRYVVRFPQGYAPPVGAFWSLTIYNAADSYLAHNPIQRYSISDRTPGVVKDADGGWSFYLQHQAPAGVEANWLPVPPGDFTVTLRTYMPKPELLNLTWKPPGIARR